MLTDRQLIGYCNRLIADAGTVEIRLLGQHPQSGLFDNADALMACIWQHRNHGKVYTSLNRPGGHIRATNRMGASALRDADIAEIVRLPFDFDPCRPAGVSSTDDEMANSLDSRSRFVAYMTSRGWPMPILASSGNGYHAQYRVKLPANDETREMTRLIYRTLALMFSDELVGFDQTVENPSRIFRAYGTLNAKGEPTADRPHRVAEVRTPAVLQIVPMRKVAALADEFSRRTAKPTRRFIPAVGGSVTGSGDYRTLDVAAWFQSAALYRGRSTERGKHYVTCPWRGEHTTPSPATGSDTVVWDADGGWPTFHCSHSHCAGRTMRDVLAVLPNADAYCSTRFAKRAA